jgi:UDP-N-acetyl-D-mannosaminuronate dehydrogenase
VPELPDHGLRSGRLPEATEAIDLAVIVTAHPNIDSAQVVRSAPAVVDFRGVTRTAQYADTPQP